MQAASDSLLGWCPAVGFDGQKRDFYVRQLWDWKRSAEVETLPPRGPGDLRAACAAGRWRAPTPAPATRSRSASYLGSGDAFDTAIAEFSELYADQSERDHAALVTAIDAGRIDAEEF